jgi:hypothetical protein
MKTYQKGAGFEIRHGHSYQHKRTIPFGIMFKIWMGNPLSIIGFFFFIMGLPFALIFIPFSTLFSPSFSDEDPVTPGIIVEVIPTNSYINDVRVFEYKYKYKLKSGPVYYGTGYSTGESKNMEEEVFIQYKEDKPELSKALDLRESAFGGGIGLLTLIFPGIGLVMLFFSTRKAIRHINILRIGNLAEGKFLFKEPTNVQINNQTVYALTFEFTASDNKSYQVIAKTHHFHRLEDEAFEKLVYDPGNPQNAVLLDELPGGIKNYFLKMV